MDEGKELSIPTIDVEEFKTRTKNFVKEIFNVLLDGARSGGVRWMQDDNILAFAKTILGGDLLKNSMVELTSESFQDTQREALSSTAAEFLKQGYSVSLLNTPQQVDECTRKVSRMDFDLQFYTLLI